MKFTLRGFYPAEREELQEALNDIEDGANRAGVELSGTITEEALHQRGKYVSADTNLRSSVHHLLLPMNA